MKTASKRVRGQPHKRSNAAARKVAIRGARPLHKRVLLHPFSVMVLLCVGVLIAGSTFRGLAASYDVTATVPAPLPAAPAVIQQPASGTFVSSKPITVSGTCTPQSYVKLYRNSTLSGLAACSAGQTFTISTDVSVGANELNARIFNVTDQEGPSSLPVTVYYAAPEPPASAPVSLQVSNLERSGFHKSAVQEVSVSPTVSGYAPPFSEVTVTFHSVVSTCKTKADARGVWVCTLSNELVLGLHEVEVVAVTPEGDTLVFPSFKIRVKDDKPTIKQSAPSIVLDTEYQYRVQKVGELFEWQVGITGGTPPYRVSIEWGDGTKDTQGHPDQSTVALSHAYSTPKDYPILVTITDANGQSATVQWVAIVKDALAYAALIRSDKDGWSAVLDTVKQWLWVVWPIYIAVVLMVLSYWIGEQEGARRLLFRRASPTSRSKSR